MAHYDVNILVWQIFFAVSMFFSTFFSYLFPIIIFTRRNRSLCSSSNQEGIQQSHHWSDLSVTDPHSHPKNRWKRFLSYCNCISAGVFLGVCFLSLIPCVEDEFSNLIKDNPTIKDLTGDFALGQFSVICGLLFVLFLENFLSHCFKNKSEHSHEVPVLYLEEEPEEHPTNIINEDHLEQEELLLNSDHISSINVDTHGNVSSPSNQNDNTFMHNNGNHHGHHHYDVGSMVTRSDSMFSFFLIMFATSIHSLFEGMALGLQSNIKTAIHLFIGIILHECLVALALGLNAIRLQRDEIRIQIHIKFAIAFSLTIPLGNVLGILLGYTPGHTGRYVSAIFQGFAAGTFIHVVFFELIPGEFISNDDFDSLSRPVSSDHRGNKFNTIQENDNQQHDQTIIDNHDADHNLIRDHIINEASKLKLRKILLLSSGFFLMALVAFFFTD